MYGGYAATRGITAAEALRERRLQVTRNSAHQSQDVRREHAPRKQICSFVSQVEQAQFAHLCTVMCSMHHRRAGYPFGTLIDFASDGAGFPIFCMSPLAIHTRNIVEDPRCSLVVQLPGWTGLVRCLHCLAEGGPHTRRRVPRIS